MKRKEISREELEDIYIIQNNSKLETSKILGVSEATISNYLRKYNIHKTAEQIVECREKTNIDKFGFTNHMKTEEQKNKFLERLKKDGIIKDIDFFELKNVYLDMNKSVEETAAIFGVSKSTIRRLIKKHNLSKSAEQTRGFKHGRNKLGFYDLERYYVKENHSIEETAEHFNMSLSGIKFLIRKYDLHKSEELRIEKIKNTIVQKYGVEHPLELEAFKNKARNTLLERYGVDNFLKSEIYKENCIKKYGVNHGFKSKEVLEKCYATKTKNNTWNSSNPEILFYNKLVETYGNEDVIRQYREERYPYACDFYVKSQDLFIELNLMWTHGGHLFNENSVSDLKKLNIWKEKAKTSEYYKNAIENWTIRDVEKNNVAIKNKLNYIVYYSEEEAKNAVFHK